MSKQPTTQQITTGLNASGFGIGQSDKFSASTDPVVKTPLMQDITELDYYNHNPRIQDNPKFEEIRGSIRKTGGIDNPLAITRRPNDEHRMVFSGGNTRLRALKELYEEFSSNNDPTIQIDANQFRYVPCVFHPWHSESRTHVAHLIENDQRSSLSLIDKAKGVKKQWLIWEDEIGEKINQATFLKKLNDAGFPLSQPNCSRLMYVTNTLLELIPNALEQDKLGPRDVDEIRALRKSYETFWVANTPDDTSAAEFEPIFIESLIQCDGDNFSIKNLKHKLDISIAKIANIAVSTIRHEVDALLSPGKNNPKKAKKTAIHNLHALEKTETTNKTPETTLNEPVTTSNLYSAITQQLANTTSQYKLTDLRTENFRIANQIAKCFRLESSCITSQNIGLGFTIDIPNTPLNDQKQMWTWWTLLYLSEQDNPNNLSHLEESNMFRILRDSDRPKDLETLVGQTPTPASLHQFITDSYIEESIFVEYILLLTNCRHLHKLTTASDLSLWH